jgi:hypothetical protein
LINHTRIDTASPAAPRQRTLVNALSLPLAF